MIIEFLRWWALRLIEFVPAGWRAGGAERENGVIVSWSVRDGTPLAEISHRRDGVEQPLGTIPLPQAPPDAGPRIVARAKGARWVALRLPAGSMLERDVNLPLAAARAPEQVLAYDMDRLTPFRAEDVHWSCSREAVDRKHGTLRLHLTVIPKATALPALTALARVGLHPDRLIAARAADGADHMVLLAAPDPARERRRRALLALGAAAYGALALIAIGLPFARQWLADTELDARIAALRPRVEQVDAVRRSLSAETASRDVVGAEQARLGDPLRLLARLTELLDDATYLHEFSLSQGKLVLRGQSADAARLIAVLTAEPSIRDPAFAAPVTRVENAAADLFTIRAELVH